VEDLPTAAEVNALMTRQNTTQDDLNET